MSRKPWVDRMEDNRGAQTHKLANMMIVSAFSTLAKLIKASFEGHDLSGLYLVAADQ